MFFIDLANGEIVDSTGEKTCRLLHFTSGQKEDFVFSFKQGNDQFFLPEGCRIALAGDVAEYYPSPMFIAYGTVAPDRLSVSFTVNTSTEEYFQRVKASNTPCFADICIYDSTCEQYIRLIRFNAIADLKLDLTGRPPEPLRNYYTAEEINALFSARELDFTIADTQVVMLEHGEQPYASIDIERNSNQYKLSFSIAIPPGAPGKEGKQGEPGEPGEAGPAGYTPQKGIDYWTADDIADIHNYVENAILNGEW